MGMEGAIVFLPRGAAGGTPALLEPLLLAPGALWLTEALASAGITSFLAVCHGDDLEKAAACFPAHTEFVTEEMPDAQARLEAFLSACRGAVAVVTEPVFLSREGAGRLTKPEPLPGGASTGLFRMDAAALLEAVHGGADFAAVLRAGGEGFGCPAGQFAGAAALGTAPESRQSIWALARGLECRRLEAGGACVLDPGAVYVDPTVTVGEGTVILPGAILRGKTVIGKHCEIGPNCMVRDCAVGDGAVINASQCSESVIGSRAKVGPFAYIRPNCSVGADTKVGDFVEVKNSVIGDGTKISHLTYVGDSDVGRDVNLGCGTVTVNYDGDAKFRTVVEDNAFVGCNSNLVAPVKIGRGAYVAAGSTVTDDVPPDSLAIARASQSVKVQWAAKRKRK